MKDPRLGRRIRELRELEGWTQQQLSEITGSSRPAVSRDERTGWMDMKRILKYAEAFGVDPNLILEVLENGNSDMEKSVAHRGVRTDLRCSHRASCLWRRDTQGGRLHARRFQ